MTDITWLAAFAAGLLSFLSPCVLPLIPGYISFVAGLSIEELQAEEKRPALIWRTSLNALLFVLGFSLVFIALGASATTLGQFMLGRMNILSKIAGAVIILFGLHLTHLLPLKFLYYEKKVHLTQKPLGAAGSLLVGMAFAFGWTPCIGPILAGILAYAGTQETMREGILLLGAYSLGLGLPFILTALSINTFLVTLDKVKKHFSLIEKISGVLLIAIGLLMVTDKFSIIASYVQMFIDL